MDIFFILRGATRGDSLRTRLTGRNSFDNFADPLQQPPDSLTGANASVSGVKAIATFCHSLCLEAGKARMNA